MKRAAVSSVDAPAAIGPYSQAVRVGPWLYTSGQIALNPSTGDMVGGGVEAECRQVIANLNAVLLAAGAGFEHVIKATIYLRDLADFAIVNGVYGECFNGEPPARSCVQAAALPKGALVEIDVVAYVD